MEEFMIKIDLHVWKLSFKKLKAEEQLEIVTVRYDFIFISLPGLKNSGQVKTSMLSVKSRVLRKCYTANPPCGRSWKICTPKSSFYNKTWLQFSLFKYRVSLNFSCINCSNSFHVRYIIIYCMMLQNKK